ncbi:hypothetical protein SUSP_002231 [Sulfurospirillum sp. 'SP']|nr:hypothetical protein [Sulfurospirillum sp. 'SP']WNY99813.1 hypothetical protein SUSP_002231 [Sulfurospirillum sp. 'SP']
MKPFKKFLILQKLYAEEGQGAIFSPEMATKFYGVDFTQLSFKEDYYTALSTTIDGNGAQPSLQIYFTHEGIKKLLKTNEKMQKEINDLWEEYKDEWDLYAYEQGTLQ